MKVLSYIKGKDGSSYHRVFMPNQTIDAEVQTVTNLNEENLAWCDIVHYNRHTVISPKFLSQIRDKYGFKIVVDSDDWWEVGKDHPKYEWWRQSNVALQIREHLMYADAVTTTHERLAEIIPNKRVYVLPNALTYGEGQFAYREQPKSDRVRLLYASTVMNYSNTALIAGAMKKLKHLNIEVIVAGEHESPLFDILVKNLTDGEIPYRTFPWTDAESYMANYEGDIGILPNKPSKFNSMKSNLKVLEYAALKLPVIVSECDPYIGMPVNYFNGEKSFIDQVTRLVEDIQYRRDCGDKLHDWCVSNYNLRDWAESRLCVYKEVYDHR